MQHGIAAVAPGRVAQLVEHTPEKRGVTGSTPVPATTDAHRIRGGRFCCPYRYSCSGTPKMRSLAKHATPVSTPSAMNAVPTGVPTASPNSMHAVAMAANATRPSREAK